MSVSRISAPLEERFWSGVDRRGPDECWNWTRARQTRGLKYGIIGIGSRLDGSKRAVLAHRLAWQLTHGPLARQGLKVLHRCDNPLCCNPAHLFLGTQADNVADMFSKGRQNSANAAKTHCLRGHPFSDENTDRRIYYGHSRRYCRTCQRDYRRAIK